MNRANCTNAIYSAIPINDFIECNNCVTDRYGFPDLGDFTFLQPGSEILVPMLAKELGHLR